MRPIDAGYFKEQIAAATIKNNIEPKKGLALLELIDAQTTAYDVDKVLEQLDRKRFEAAGFDVVASEDVFKIIKAGGVNE